MKRTSEQSKPHVARHFVARTAEVRKARTRWEELILEDWGRIVLKFLRGRTSKINPKIPYLRRSEQKESCKIRATVRRWGGPSFRPPPRRPWKADGVEIC